MPYFSAKATPKLVGRAREAKKRTPRPWTFSITDCGTRPLNTKTA